MKLTCHSQVAGSACMQGHASIEIVGNGLIPLNALWTQFEKAQA
jgi:hypothetical protein